MSNDLCGPQISCVPDIIVSDVEDNTANNDVNYFIFVDALDLDDLVVDYDHPSSTIRWCFIETTPGDSIELNGLPSDPAVNVVEPGHNNLRAISRWLSVENVRWSGTAPAQSTTDSFVTLFASDGTSTDSADVIITTVNDATPPFNDGPGDGLAAPPAISHRFDTGADRWEWYAVQGLEAPEHRWNAGALEMTKAASQSPIVYGTWESPKDPSWALRAKTGCVMRAQFVLRSSVNGDGCPGFRMRALWHHVIYNERYSVYTLDFLNQDFNAEQIVAYSTFADQHIAGRDPGHAGQTYTLLYWPEQTATLASTGVVYLGLDLLDNDTFGDTSDTGTLYCDQIDIDWFDNPHVGSGRHENALSYTDVSGWTSMVSKLDDSWSTQGLWVTSTRNDISITVAPGNQMFEASCVGPETALEPGRYYRTTFLATSTQVPGGPFGPTIRGAVASSQYVYSAARDLRGGGLLSSYDAVPRPFQLWFEAPSPDPGTSATEPMSLVFESWLTQNPEMFFFKEVQGTIQCHEIITESWEPADPLFP
jgi:hypothetical protein